MNRSNTIKHTVIAAITAKGTSALLQFLSLPIAARVLGKEEFGVFSIISLTIFLLSMLQLGVGPALARGIAQSAAKNRRNRERHFYISGAILTIVIIGTGVTLLLLGVIFIPPEFIFGEKFSPYRDTVRSALIIGIILTGIEIVLWHTENSKAIWKAISLTGHFRSATWLVRSHWLSGFSFLNR